MEHLLDASLEDLKGFNVLKCFFFVCFFFTITV